MTEREDTVYRECNTSDGEEMIQGNSNKLNLINAIIGDTEDIDDLIIQFSDLMSSDSKHGFYVVIRFLVDATYSSFNFDYQTYVNLDFDFIYSNLNVDSTTIFVYTQGKIDHFYKLFSKNFNSFLNTDITNSDSLDIFYSWLTFFSSCKEQYLRESTIRFITKNIFNNNSRVINIISNATRDVSIKIQCMAFTYIGSNLDFFSLDKIIVCIVSGLSSSLEVKNTVLDVLIAICKKDLLDLVQEIYERLLFEISLILIGFNHELIIKCLDLIILLLKKKEFKFDKDELFYNLLLSDNEDIQKRVSILLFSNIIEVSTNTKTNISLFFEKLQTNIYLRYIHPELIINNFSFVDIPNILMLESIDLVQCLSYINRILKYVKKTEQFKEIYETISNYILRIGNNIIISFTNDQDILCIFLKTISLIDIEEVLINLEQFQVIFSNLLDIINRYPKVSKNIYYISELYSNYSNSQRVIQSLIISKFSGNNIEHMSLIEVGLFVEHSRYLQEVQNVRSCINLINNNILKKDDVFYLIRILKHLVRALRNEFDNRIKDIILSIPEYYITRKVKLSLVELVIEILFVHSDDNLCECLFNNLETRSIDLYVEIITKLIYNDRIPLAYIIYIPTYYDQKDWKQKVNKYFTNILIPGTKLLTLYSHLFNNGYTLEDLNTLSKLYFKRINSIDVINALDETSYIFIDALRPFFVNLMRDDAKNIHPKCAFTKSLRKTLKRKGKISLRDIQGLLNNVTVDDDEKLESTVNKRVISSFNSL